MKLKLNFKSLLVLFLLTCVSIVTISTASNAAPSQALERLHEICDGNGGTLDKLSGTNQDCEVTPDVQKVIFYSLLNFNILQLILREPPVCLLWKTEEGEGAISRDKKDKTETPT